MFSFFRIVICVALTTLFLHGCKTADTSASSTGSSPSSSGSSPSSRSDSSANIGLTNSKVEAAVSDLLDDWKMGGRVSVRGIQENSQTNSAVADLQFSDFEYGVTFQGQLLKKSQFKMPAKSGNPIPPPDEMFPPRKVKYSKDGKASLAKYNDGRWVLKAVNWGFDTGVKGSVELK